MNHRSIKINAILNGLKQCFGILFPLITFPYVSRVLGSEGFGKYSFSWSVVSYFVLIAGLGINTYAVREGARIRDNKKEIDTFCSELFTINILTTIVSFGLLIVALLISPKLSQYSVLVAIQSTALILCLVGRDWINSIYEDFLYITIRYLIIQIISMILMFLTIKQTTDVWKYSAICVFASFGGNIFNLFYVRKYTRLRVTLHPHLSKHLSPLLVLFVTQVAITVYVNADITMLGFYANDEVVGVYSLSSKIYGMIKTVVNAMAVVTLPRMTYVLENKPDEYQGLIYKVISYLLVILLPVATGVFMLSKEIIYIVGGSEYLGGTTALRILSGAMIFAVLGSFSMNSILIANRLEKVCLKATAISALVNILLNFIALPTLGMYGAAITTVIAEAVNLFILLRNSRGIIRISDLDKKNVLQCICGSCVIVLFCSLVHRYSNGYIRTTIVCFLGASLLYFLTLLLLKNQYLKETVFSFKSRFKWNKKGK